MRKILRYTSVWEPLNFISFCFLLYSILSLHVAGVAEAKEAEKTTKFPSRPIKIIIPAGASGSLSQEARAIAPFLEKRIGVPIVFNYVPGAEGIIAYNKFYKEKADGYTVAYYGLLSAIMLELTRESAKYEVSKFSPIAAWNVKNQILGVHPDVWNTFAEFLHDAKNRKISMGGVGGTSLLNAYLLESALGIKINFIPYDASAEAIVAVMGKHLDSVITHPSTPKPMIQAGKLRALAILALQPDPVLPKVPNLKELGHGDVPVLPVFGMFAAPPNTPKEIVAILERAVSKAAAEPAFQKLSENIGVAVECKSSGDLKRLISEHYDTLNKYRQLIR